MPFFGVRPELCGVCKYSLNFVWGFCGSCGFCVTSSDFFLALRVRFRVNNSMVLRGGFTWHP